MKDILTPRERFGMLVIDEVPDRCMVMPLITSHAAYAAGISLREYYTDGIKMAKAQLTAVQIYEHDAVSIFSEVGIIAEAMGSVFDYPKDDLPILREPMLREKPVSALAVPDPSKHGRLPVYLEAIDYAYRSAGDRIPILAYVPAPFTTSMMLSDPEEFLKQTIRQPDEVSKMMQITLAAATEFCCSIIDAGGLPIIVDPLASSSVISPRIFKQFALPCLRSLIDFLHRYDLDIILHICGDTAPILDLLGETAADLLSIDQVNIDDCLIGFGKRQRLIGNLDTSKLAFASPAEIINQTEEMVKKAKINPKGYIAATGCEVPIKADPENVKAFIQTAREVGWYWE